MSENVDQLNFPPIVSDEPESPGAGIGLFLLAFTAAVLALSITVDSLLGMLR